MGKKTKALPGEYYTSHTAEVLRGIVGLDTDKEGLITQKGISAQSKKLKEGSSGV